MFVRARISIEDIVEAIEGRGGVVKWEGNAPAPHLGIGFDDVEVDNEEAWDHLPSNWREPEEVERGDPRDIRDFVAACLAGDRDLAVALIPRLWENPAAQTEAEQVLRPVRRAA